MEITRRFPLSLPDDGDDEFSPGLHADSLMAQQVHPDHLKPSGAVRSAIKTTQIIRRGRARIPSWLEADSSPHPEAVYIGADRSVIEGSCLQSGDGPYIQH
jgi:hypothetical protein